MTSAQIDAQSAEMIVPKHDWLMPDEDGWSGSIIELRCLDAADAPKTFIPLTDLPAGHVQDDGDGWQDDFDKNSTYPPIVVEATPTGQFQITQGNHRVIM